jgi:hypothetical protein
MNFFEWLFSVPTRPAEILAKAMTIAGGSCIVFIFATFTWLGLEEYGRRKQILGTMFFPVVMASYFVFKVGQLFGFMGRGLLLNK